MKKAAAVLLFLCLTTGLVPAQSMFRGGPAHTGVYPGPAPRAFHRVKWKFPTGDRVVSSPVWHEGVIYFGGDDGNIYAVDATNGRQLWKHATGGPAPSSPAVSDGVVYALSYDGKLYALDARTGGTRWKFTTGGERRFEAKGLHGTQPKNQTIADAFDVFLSSPVVAQGAVYFGSGDGNLYAVDTASGRTALEISDRRRGAFFARLRRRRALLRKLGQLFLRGGGRNWKGEVAFSRRRRSGVPQPGWVPVLARGGRWRRLYRLPRRAALRARRRDREREMAVRQRHELGHQLARGRSMAKSTSRLRTRAFTTSSRPRPGSRS